MYGTPWQALMATRRGTDPYLAHWLNATLYLMTKGVLLLVVMDLRCLANRWDTPSPREQRRRRRSLIGNVLLLFLLLLAMMQRT